MRADVYLAAFGHAQSRKKAQDLIGAGAVSIDGKIIKKASEPINENAPHSVRIEKLFKYVGRGGMKLEAALDAFGISVNRLKAVDVGASTGGFTDCLLQRGAASVCAVDAGMGQLHPDIRANKKVTCIEHFNARELTPAVTGGECDVAVADVSFISQTYIIEPIAAVLKPHGIFISLIKPQFEAGRAALDKHGVVKSAAYRYLAAKRVISFACERGFDCLGLIRSPIDGGDGNREYLAYFVKKECIKPRVDDAWIKRVTEQ